MRPALSAAPEWNSWSFWCEPLPTSRAAASRMVSDAHAGAAPRNAHLAVMFTATSRRFSRHIRRRTIVGGRLASTSLQRAALGGLRCARPPNCLQCNRSFRHALSRTTFTSRYKDRGAERRKWVRHRRVAKVDGSMTRVQRTSDTKLQMYKNMSRNRAISRVVTSTGRHSLRSSTLPMKF